MSMHFPLRVEMEDGATWDVVADQRDCAAWEMQPFGTAFAAAGSKGVLVTRWMAWHAGKRNGLHKITWDRFCEQAVFVSDVPSTEDDAEDPGPRAA